MNDKELTLFRHHVEVVERLCKGRKAGIDKALVKPNCLYVLDWRPDQKERFDGVKVEHVLAVDGEEVTLPNSYTDLATFASLVVAGPFSL